MPLADQRTRRRGFRVLRQSFRRRPFLLHGPRPPRLSAPPPLEPLPHCGGIGRHAEERTRATGCSAIPHLAALTRGGAPNCKSNWTNALSRVTLPLLGGKTMADILISASAGAPAITSFRGIQFIAAWSDTTATAINAVPLAMGGGARGSPFLLHS